jgi:catechol 2,3-dioxygenase-like lactoylglutathione lyase family enzyme
MLARAVSGTPLRLELDHVAVRTSDPLLIRDFYVRVLDAEVVELDRGRVGVRFGGWQLNLHGPESTPEPLPERVPAPGGLDLCLVWSDAPESAAAHLRSRGVEPERGPVPRRGARGDGRSVYFRDPDGNLLELLSYA